MEIKAELRQYLAQKKWPFKPASGSPKDLAVKTCPFCGKSKWKFWIEAKTTKYRCWHCPAKGNLYKLKREMGDLKGAQSAAQFTGQGEKKQSKPLPMEYVDTWHRSLLKSKKGMDYCRNRGFTRETIKHFRLGLQKKHNRLWLAIPHISDGICHNVKFRTLPPHDKAFRRIKGGASVLYNADALAEYEEIIIAEAELDAISFWVAGIKNVISLTCGADTFLEEWYDLLVDKEKIILVLDADPVGQHGARDIARRLGFDRCYNILLPAHDANVCLTELGADELASSLELEEQFQVGGVVTAADLMLRCKHREELGDVGLLTPWDHMNAIIGRGFQPGDLWVLSAKIKVGKALRHGEVVWTPAGTVPIEDITIHDTVLGVDGTAYPVTGVYPQGTVDIYCVTFSDGSSVDVSSDHLWKVTRVRNNKQKRSETLSTLEMLAEGLEYKPGCRKFKIPMAEPLDLETSPVDIDPYLMGVLIGDGCLSSATSPVIACSDQRVRDEVTSVIPKGTSIKDIDGCSFRISAARGSKQGKLLPSALRKYNLAGKKAHQKEIPVQYLLNDLEVRIRLLQGLMDTDGTIAKNGTLQYSTTSKHLACQVKCLVQTLGGRATVMVKDSPVCQGKVCRPSYTINLSLGEGITPFIRPHKLERFKAFQNRRKRNFRTIADIKHVGRHQATCISVNSPDNLFVCSHGIVTHNTTLALNQALYLAQHGIPSCVHCLEMGVVRLGDKLAAMLRNKPVDDLTNMDFAMARYILRRIPLYFIEPDWKGELSKEAVFDKIREVVKRHGIKFFVFDHLHFLCRSLKYVVTEVGQVTRGFKLLSEELQMVTCLIAQPKKIGSGRMITYDDIKDSSAIPADADWVLLMHRRPRPVDVTDIESASDQEVLDPKTVIRFDATRFRGGGECILYYDGETARFLDWGDRPSDYRDQR